MNKAVHALVYVILAIAAAALYFEMNLYKKRAMQEDRHQVLVDYISKIAHTIEKADAPKPTTAPEARKDVSPVEAKLVEVPEMENLLEDYAVQLEEANLETFKWGSAEKAQLRKVYAEMNGEPIADPANPGSYQKEGPGTASEILGQLFDRAKAQQAKLNSTRAELATVRTKIEALVNDYNKLKPEGRQDKLTIEELKQKVADTEAAKAEAEEQVKKTKAQVEELSAEVVSLKDEVSSAKDETDAVKEDLAKSQKLVDQLKTLLQKQQRPVAAQAASGGVSAAQVTAGNKGKVVAVDNGGMFAVVEMSDDAMNELIGEERKNGLPLLEMALRRNGFKGPSGEYIGRVRLRQAISGKNLVIVDVLGDWKQADIKVGDVVFAE